MEIPISILILLCLIFTVIGSVIMLLLQYYVYLKIANVPEETTEQKSINAKYSLPLAIQQTARAINSASSIETATSPMSNAASAPTTPHSSFDAGTAAAPLMSLNFLMQFLFHELKNTNRVRKWFYRKLSLELDELIAKTTTGKLFDKLTIKELELGDQFPEIKSMRVHAVELDEHATRIENLDVLLDLHYTGNFCTSIDVDMVLGKKGSLTLKVKQLSGLARLQFTRKPYTHWSLSFLGDPELDLAVESRYQGRQMQSNITSLISNQIRKSVRRKHTLPNYKLRYKPFFHKAPEEDAGDCDIQPNGVVEVKVSEISRLWCLQQVTDIYCTLTMASLAFVEARQKDDRNVIVSLDVEIHKAKNQQIGIVFKQTQEPSVEIEAVLPNTPAWKSNLRAGDVLIAIEGKRVTSIQQVAKVVKGLPSTLFCLRIERVIPGIIRNDAILEDLELYEDLGDLHTGYTSKPTELESVAKQLLVRHSSPEKCNLSDSSLSSTPTNSPKKTKLIAKAIKKTISRENSDSKKLLAEDEEGKTKSKFNIKPEEKVKLCSSSVVDGVYEVEHYQQHSTIDCTFNRLMHMEDLSSFKLSAETRYLNICVYGKCAGNSLLLGFLNISVSQILADCCETSLSQCWKRFQLNPPIPQDLKSHYLSNQSGFNPNLCFGDLLLAFSWEGSPSFASPEVNSKQTSRNRTKSISQSERTDDSGIFDNTSTKSANSSDSSTSTVTLSQPRSHNFIRTHFHRATQCDFCGKKIWLKDAVQCRECVMSCHKKCITKCQNSTVCGPVDCAGSIQQTPTSSVTPEFMVTEAADGFEAIEGEETPLNITEDEPKETKSNLDTHRASLTGLLAQGIKRVNSANNLAIPGIVSSLTGNSGGGGGGGSNSSGNTTGNITNTKSLPPSPQHSPSRKSSLVLTASNGNPFETVTQRLESISENLTSLNPDQISYITEPIINIPRETDVMTLAKSASRSLYNNIAASDRVKRINGLLSKLRLALDSETSIHSTLTTAVESTQRNSLNHASVIERSEERVQALSVIMLFLCTGLQHAQGVAFN